MLGEKIIFLIEVKNVGDIPILLGNQPLLETSTNNCYDVLGNCVTCFSQNNQDRVGFFETTYSYFPSGTESEVKTVSIPAGETYSEIITRTPWGPCIACIPSYAQAGKMTLQVSMVQFLPADLKKHELASNKIHLTVVQK